VCTLPPERIASSTIGLVVPTASARGFTPAKFVRDAAGELGHAVDLLHAVAAPSRQEAPLDLDRADRGAGRHDAQRGIVVLADGDVGKRAERRRYAAAMGDAVGFDQLPVMGDEGGIARAAGAGDDEGWRRPTMPPPARQTGRRHGTAGARSGRGSPFR